MYRCPICGFKTIRLFALKQHARHVHVLTVCPVCKKEYLNIYQHFYVNAYSDNKHLVLCYLFTTNKLKSFAKRKVKELLRC
ncbi:hypothetical protein [Sulfolobus spindle-shaped virus]|nr:hypothetical protein [Sulfolobus spindle-shaped virus]AZG03616.1 hypothetical protein [Sulfolobus spindle-shaped virus]AZG03720.1 hypothetical protein [Sulfolobus spindle-shaped virus]AZG03754.1 hypothetical protein [Sulfolobus spindle-shaped virus]AZG03778.1 hypothetical protein [Sulfolobus spindle-shaped virus]